jgi:ribosomal protein S18 acetylase RimI-like enzyme
MAESLEVRLANLNRDNDSEVLAVANGEFELCKETRRDFKDARSHIAERFRYLTDKELVRKTRSNVMIARVAGGVVGYAIYSLADELGFLSSLYVKKCFRNFEIGAKMMDMVIRECRQRGAGKIYLVSSSKAKDFYRSFGFEDTKLYGLRNEMLLTLDKDKQGKR